MRYPSTTYPTHNVLGIATLIPHSTTRSPFASHISLLRPYSLFLSLYDYALKSQVLYHWDADRCDMTPSTPHVRPNLSHRRKPFARHIEEYSPRAFYITVLVIGTICLLSFVPGPHQARQEWQSSSVTRDTGTLKHGTVNHDAPDVSAPQASYPLEQYLIWVITVPFRPYRARPMFLRPYPLS